MANNYYKSKVDNFADLIKRIGPINSIGLSDWVYQPFEFSYNNTVGERRFLIKTYNNETLFFDYSESNVWEFYKCGSDCIVKYNNFVFYDTLLIDLNTNKIVYNNLEKLALKNLDNKGFYLTIIGAERAVNGHPRVPQCNQLVSTDDFTVPVTQIFDVVRVGDVFISYNSDHYYRGSMMGKPYDTSEKEMTDDDSTFKKRKYN